MVGTAGRCWWLSPRPSSCSAPWQAARLQSIAVIMWQSQTESPAPGVDQAQLPAPGEWLSRCETVSLSGCVSFCLSIPLLLESFKWRESKRRFPPITLARGLLCGNVHTCFISVISCTVTGRFQHRSNRTVVSSFLWYSSYCFSFISFTFNSTNIMVRMQIPHLETS